ncbi:hypothetical protein Pst134EA_015806 [Puccinia striiformis f. sp. tritici]|uniref:Uncharacterized protein n=1 Tax=Puccinia striiformis f. sp. tritici PST-78 TaxID=1165861 RepID=A0A0L0VFD3_9BASI|nr:hypothetical protein Pst134EA_015806 [Puccinia striiformis f. sp. tritici]KAI9602486.1 hypothetical protein H4Q26_001775 [Puccinia striiformis f. sp. tritici PST-130]KNE97992.1 hypothetical protein PSTG_08667 [Puccinia striiformis f. sp. tritici PST-78]KAH9452959.1 hypothetical protein Pst134EB_016900 [Puccinia striiformis f. sp. tritici]KAH9463720.1 hypothetical protein Pst134EA_015806 [Puccinia striiformis f. sp. tritici]KAI9605552.1 hypothetical protein KEM48_002087 [Puccinia striiformis
MLLFIKSLPVWLMITLHGQLTEGKGSVDMALAQPCPQSNPLPICLKVHRLGPHTEEKVSARKGLVQDSEKGIFSCQAYADLSNNDELLKALCCSAKAGVQQQNVQWFTKPVPLTLNDQNCPKATSV